MKYAGMMACMLMALATLVRAEPLATEEAMAKLEAKKAATSQPDLKAEVDRLRREVVALKAENKRLLDELQSDRENRVQEMLKAAAAPPVKKDDRKPQDVLKIGMTEKEVEFFFAGSSLDSPSKKLTAETADAREIEWYCVVQVVDPPPPRPTGDLYGRTGSYKNVSVGGRSGTRGKTVKVCDIVFREGKISEIRWP